MIVTKVRRCSEGGVLIVLRQPVRYPPSTPPPQEIIFPHFAFVECSTSEVASKPPMGVCYVFFYLLCPILLYPLLPCLLLSSPAAFISKRRLSYYRI